MSEQKKLDVLEEKYRLVLEQIKRLIPNEPGVGSFGLLIGGGVGQRTDYEESEYCWFYDGEDTNFMSWAEIYPLITRLYNSSGDEVAGFQYAKSDSK